MITSTSNARVKRLVNLRKKRKARDEEGVFLVEGIRMFREVPVDKLQEVYVSESFYKKEKETVKKSAGRRKHPSGTSIRYGIFAYIRYEDASRDSVRGKADGSHTESHY